MAFSSLHTTDVLKARYEKMYFLTKDRLIGFVKYAVQDTAVADDIVQDCYIRLWENMDNVVDDDTVISLLRTYARHRIIDHIRKSARDALRNTTYQLLQPACCSSDDLLLLKDITRQYDAVVKALPPKRRAVYRLVKEEGLSHKEIAARLNISTNTIEKHINEAMGALRGAIK
jgi:RNA polymerase sigma-70 factor (ECF subfamily)